MNATLDDYLIAVNIFQQIESTTSFGVGDNVLRFYEACKKELVGKTKLHLTYDDCQQIYYDVFNKHVARWWLKEAYIKPLSYVGAMEEKPDPDDKRRKIIVVTTVKPTPYIQHDGFLKEYTGMYRNVPIDDTSHNVKINIKEGGGL